MELVPTITFPEARARVIHQVTLGRSLPVTELVDLPAACGRVIAQSIYADRDYPTLDRSVRDGFAVRSPDVPGRLKVIGEVRAGEMFNGTVHAGEAVEIMTGAPIPEGADAVVMIEHVVRQGEWIVYDKLAPSGQFVSPKGEELLSGAELCGPGKRLDYTDIALLASVGCSAVHVYAKPRVAIIATGDEIVAIDDPAAAAYQIRNSNAYSLAAQVRRAGGVPEVLAVAKDDRDDTRGLIDRGLASDLLILSGGVSAGKYDIVESVLSGFGAEFYFDRVAIQPGQPAVFGRAREKFVFGLPGNPASTMVTFEIFARAALDLLAGATESRLPVALGRLTREFRHKTGLTRFLPATLSECGSLTPVAWKGSSDMAALARANTFLMADADREQWNAGDIMPVLMK